MWNFLFKKTYKKASFEDIQFSLSHPELFLLINTLSADDQKCLIKNTILYQMEENMVNELLSKYDYSGKRFIVYGRNANDGTAEIKCKQLETLGFSNVYLYAGGLFEWLLLQDIYGKDEFPTTTAQLDILKYKPDKMFSGRYTPLHILNR